MSALSRFAPTLARSALLHHRRQMASSALTDSKWLQFKQKFGKNYTSRTEEAFRRTIVAREKAYIELHNAQQPPGMPRYQMGLNHMSDLTDEELRQQKFGLLCSKGEQEGGQQAQAGSSPNAEVSVEQDRQYIQQIIDGPGEVPDEIDWRRYSNRVGRVKDQGECGACWAFATTGVLEGQQTKVGFSRLVSLSEQNLVDCDKYNRGCCGGYMDRAMRTIEEMNGIMDEQSYPYEAAKGPCRFDASRVAMRVGGSAVIWEMDEGELKKLVAKYGPVAAAIYARTSFIRHRSGIYWDKEWHACDDEVNHGILIVGYGTDENGFDYWLIKNSWNTWWGEQGYAKILRTGDGHCCINYGPTIPRLCTQ